MSFVMDSRDLIGFLRGACLVGVVRHVSRSPQRDDVSAGLAGVVGNAVCEFAAPLAKYTSVDRESIEASPRELLEEGAGHFYEVDNINLQLGLLSRKPMPIYPFVSADAVDSVVLMRPFLDVSKNLLHAAVRLGCRQHQPHRKETSGNKPISSSGGVGGDPPAGLFRCVGADVASDIIFHNHDIFHRSDAEQAARARTVFDELRAVWRSHV